MNESPTTTRIQALYNGNTALLEALMEMVNQFFMETDDGKLRHSFMSAEETAIGVLLDAGMASGSERDGFVLHWDKLEDRKRAD